MHIEVARQGISDTLQDLGRFGRQHLGIPPGGVMDPIAARVANALVGNPPGEGVLELHHPAGALLFLHPVLIGLAGADFQAHVGDIAMPANAPVAMPAGATLEFKGRARGARCYLAVRGGFAIEPWLGSLSTNLKARAGGFLGRALQKGDLLSLRKPEPALLQGYPYTTPDSNASALHWQADTQALYGSGPFRIIPGPEYARLKPGSVRLLDSLPFQLLTQSDRMGYRLKGPNLETQTKTELISSGLTSGCMELLPSGQVILLMADHPTTGGYPRIGHVASADLGRLAQAAPGESLRFAWMDAHSAEEALWHLEQHLRVLEASCHFRITQYIASHAPH